MSSWAGLSFGNPTLLHFVEDTAVYEMIRCLVSLKLKLSRKDPHCQYCREEYDDAKRSRNITESQRVSCNGASVTLASSITVLLIMPVKGNRMLIL